MTESFATAVITAPSGLITLPIAFADTNGVSIMSAAQTTDPDMGVSTVLESASQVRVYVTSTVTVSIEARRL